MPSLSIVVPVYGCTECLRALHRRLVATLEGMASDWQIVYVDDCSPGESWPLLVDLAEGDPRVRAYHLSRNSGQSAAIAAGLAHSEGERVVVMDCDLQDPPEAIPSLDAKADEGYDVVFTIRGSPPSYGLLRRLGTAAYLRLRNLAADRDQRARYSGFTLISRRAASAVLSAGRRHPSYLMTLRSLGFHSAAIEVPRDERYAGESSYTLPSLIKVGIANLAFQYRGRVVDQPRSPRRPRYVVDREAPGEGAAPAESGEARETVARP
jgi:glycosyltransferase involved in cell wall biosynthesis